MGQWQACRIAYCSLKDVINIKEFFKRLLQTIVNIIGFATGFALMVGTVTLIIIYNNPVIEAIVKWGIGIPFGIGIILLLGQYINWQFIEPFRKDKTR